MNLAQSVPTSIRHAIEDSRVLAVIRPVIRGSWLAGAVRKVCQPTPWVVQGPRAWETDLESAAALQQMLTVVSASAPGRLLRGAGAAGVYAWDSSAAVRLWVGIQKMALIDRVQLGGAVMLIASVIAGVTKFVLEGPWPAISVLLWACSVGLALVVTVGAHHFAAAWSHYRQ